MARLARCTELGKSQECRRQQLHARAHRSVDEERRGGSQAVGEPDRVSSMEPTDSHCPVLQAIAVQAYSPLTQGKKLGDPVVAEVARKHGKTAAQVVLRWVLQQGVIVIPKSENLGRIRENAAIYDFSLDDDDLFKIARLDAGQNGNIGDWNSWDYK